MAKSRHSRFVAVDFFCGAGGMTNGLIKAGFHVLAGVDNEPLCEKTYRQNVNQSGAKPVFLPLDIFPRSRTHPHGQQELIVEQLETLIRAYKRKSGFRKLHLVFAICAPCQPFTKITKIQMSEDSHFRRANDANLLLTTLKLIRHFKPSAIVCENVEGIGSGDDSVLHAFKRRLNRSGFRFRAALVNACDFGVPQNRKRTIGIGFSRVLASADFDLPVHDPARRSPTTVREVIGHLPPIAAGEVHPSIPNHRARALSPLNLKRISCAPPGETNHYLLTTKYGDLSLTCHKRLEKKVGKSSFSDTYTRLHGDRLAPTITTKFVGVSNGRFAHYDVTQNRAISPREAALLQTFPDKFIFYPEDNIEFTAKLIGNAVPPRLAEFYGKFLKFYLA